MVKKLKQKKYIGGERSCGSRQVAHQHLPHKKHGPLTKPSNQSNAKQIHEALTTSKKATHNASSHHHGHQGGGGGGITRVKHYCHGKPGPASAHAVKHISLEPSRFSGGIKQNKHVNQNTNNHTVTSHNLEAQHMRRYDQCTPGPKPKYVPPPAPSCLSGGGNNTKRRRRTKHRRTKHRRTKHRRTKHRRTKHRRTKNRRTKHRHTKHRQTIHRRKYNKRSTRRRISKYK